MAQCGLRSQAEKPSEAIEWAARLEGLVPPRRFYVARQHLIDAIQAAVPDAPQQARTLALATIEPMPDQTRAPGWPFYMRRIVVYLYGDRAPMAPTRSSSGSSHTAAASAEGAHTSRGGQAKLQLRRVEWTLAEARAHAWETVLPALHLIAARGDYQHDAWGTAAAAFMMAAFDHHNGRRVDPPVRTRESYTCPDPKRLIVVGWLGAPWGGSLETLDVVAMHLSGTVDTIVTDDELDAAYARLKDEASDRQRHQQ